MREHVAVRLEAEEIERIDAVAKAISQPWHKATRSDALRALFLKGLASWAIDHPSAVPTTVVHGEAPTELRPKRKAGRRKSSLVEDVALKARAQAALDNILKRNGV